MNSVLNKLFHQFNDRCKNVESILKLNIEYQQEEFSKVSKGYQHSGNGIVLIYNASLVAEFSCCESSYYLIIVEMQPRQFTVRVNSLQHPTLNPQRDILHVCFKPWQCNPKQCYTQLNLLMSKGFKGFYSVQDCTAHNFCIQDYTKHLTTSPLLSLFPLILIFPRGQNNPKHHSKNQFNHLTFCEFYTKLYQYLYLK